MLIVILPGISPLIAGHCCRPKEQLGSADWRTSVMTPAGALLGYGMGMGKPMGLEVWVCEVLVRVGQSKPSSTMGFCGFPKAEFEP